MLLRWLHCTSGSPLPLRGGKCHLCWTGTGAHSLTGSQTERSTGVENPAEVALKLLPGKAALSKHICCSYIICWPSTHAAICQYGTVPDPLSLPANQQQAPAADCTFWGPFSSTTPWRRMRSLAASTSCPLEDPQCGIRKAFPWSPIIAETQYLGKE